MDDAERRDLVDEWFRSYSARVYAYLLHRTDNQTAQDVLQEVFVTAFGKAEQVTEQPLGWLFGTARRLLANRRRGSRRLDQLITRLVENVGDDFDSDEAELRLAFAQTLATLPEADREVLTLTGWYDLAPIDAAASLGCTASTYAVRLHRARKRLASELEAAGYRGASPVGQFVEALRG